MLKYINYVCVFGCGHNVCLCVNLLLPPGLVFVYYFYYNIPSFLLPPSLFFCPLSSNPTHLFFPVTFFPPGVLYYLYPHMKEESTSKQEVLQVVMATYSSLLDACLASDMVRCRHPNILSSPQHTVLEYPSRVLLFYFTFICSCYF